MVLLNGWKSGGNPGERMQRTLCVESIYSAEEMIY